MKTYISILILYLTISFCGKNYCQEDSILFELKSRINKNWETEVSNDTLIIECKDYMLISFYNIARIPVDDPGLQKISDFYMKNPLPF